MKERQSGAMRGRGDARSEDEPCRERVLRVQQILRRPGHPGPPGETGHHRGDTGDLGRTEQAIALLNKSLDRNPSYGSAQLFLVAALSLMGRRSDAAETAASFRAQYPDYRTNTFEQLWMSRSGSSVYRAQIHPLFEKICSLGVAN